MPILTRTERRTAWLAFCVFAVGFLAALGALQAIGSYHDLERCLAKQSASSCLYALR